MIRGMLICALFWSVAFAGVAEGAFIRLTFQGDASELGPSFEEAGYPDAGTFYGEVRFDLKHHTADIGPLVATYTFDRPWWRIWFDNGVVWRAQPDLRVVLRLQNDYPYDDGAEECEDGDAWFEDRIEVGLGNIDISFHAYQPCDRSEGPGILISTLLEDLAFPGRELWAPFNDEKFLVVHSWEGFSGLLDIDEQSIVFTRIPEPTTLTLLAVGLIALRRFRAFNRRT